MNWWQRQTTTDRVLFASLGIAILILLGVIGPLLRPTQRADNRETQIAAPIQRTATTPTTRVTKANYEKLREGMKQEEVIAILGPVGEVKYEAKEPSGSAAVYQWGTAGEGFILCTMKDEKLIGKTQVSLRY